MKKKSRLILALDVTDKSEALRIAADVGALVDAIKVGYPLILSSGLGIVNELAQYGDVLCDLKIADIPNTNRLIAEQVFKNRAAGVIVHGFTGKDSVEACVAAAKGKDVFVIAEMSHPGAKQFIQFFSEALAELAVEVRATGIVAPGTRPERIKKLRETVGDLLIIAPGIGVQGGSASAALTAGADYVIVGRTIYEAQQPKKAVEELISQIHMHS
jgi:orotidine-5'-phosphate decarboxylase